MAHGFLSYQDGRGVSELEQQLTRIVGDQIEDYSKKLYNALRNRMLRVEEVAVDTNKQVSQLSGNQPLKLKGSEPAAITGGKLSRLVSREQSALPGSRATPTTPMGGAIVNMGFGGSRLKPEGFSGDQIIDITATPVNDNNQLVQAIDRLTFVSMNLLAETKEQTAIAQRQQNFFEKLARKDKAALEEAALEQGRDLSGNLAYKRVGGRSPAGLLPGGPSRAQEAIQSLGQSLIKRAPQATRTAAGIAANRSLINTRQAGAISSALKSGRVGAGIVKTISEAGIAKTLATGGPRAMKIAETAQANAKPVNTIKQKLSKKRRSSNIEGEKLQKLIDSGVDPADAIRRVDPSMAKRLTEVGKTAGVSTALQARVGDTVPTAVRQSDDVIKGALGAADGPLAKMLGKGLGKSILKKIPVIAGVAGIVFGIQRALEGDFLGAGLEITSGILGATGVGGFAGAGIDAFLLARDFGVTPFAQGGIPLGQNVPALLNDRPDKAREAVMPLTDETFLKFGEGNLRALERNRGKYVRLEAEVLAQAIEMSKDDRSWLQKLLGIGGDDNGGGNDGKSKKAWWDPLGVFTGNGGAESRTPMLTPPPPLPPITGTDSVSMARSLIVDKEGFAETPYWDVNAYRAGYGSDTYTTADGTVKQVQQGVNITRADADRDIDRRISTEFMPEARRAVGPDIWDSLPAGAQAALTSIAYNYGSVPGRVTRVAKSTNGNIEAIASAVEGLKNDDGGINSGRRQHEADMIRSSAGQASASLTPPPAIGDQSSITPATVDNGGALSSTSQQVATAALAPKQTPIVQNIITGGQQQQQGTNIPNQVAFGTSHASQGGDLYSNMRVRSLVG